MAEIKAMAGIGKLSPEGVNKIADGFRADVLTDSAMAELKNQLGTKLQPLFDLDEGEVKMLNALPPESVETLFHVCNRAVTSGGKVEYERQETGGPKMQPSISITSLRTAALQSRLAMRRSSALSRCALRARITL